MNDEEGVFAGPTVKVEFGGHEVTSSICEHRLPAVECQECDIFGQGYRVEDGSTWRDRLRDPLGWIKIRWWMIKHNRRK